MNLGEQIQQLRKYKKMSQESLAKKVGVSRQSISKWETGVAYPEMKHIMKLCSIFHCKITDLIHGQLNDLNEINDDIKENIVKLKTKKQKRLKKISKMISSISKILKMYTLIVIMFIIVFMFASPFICQKIEIHEDKVIFIDEQVEYDETSDTYYEYNTKSAVNLKKGSMEAQFINQFKDYSNLELIIGLETLLVLFLIYMICFYWLNETIQYLFMNISSKNTPFTFINMMHIRHISKYLFILFICHTVIKVFINIFVINSFIFNIDIMQIVYILALICLSYIFEYGYEIQSDSNGVIYEEA